MRAWLKQLDQLLRGEATRLETLRDGAIDVSVRGLCVVIVALALIYGVCMGTYSLFKDVDPGVVGAGSIPWQLVASTIKVPTLFFLTLLVTFPSLYVFNALVGSRLSAVAVLRLLVASLGVNVAVLASLGPIVAFFSVSTRSYPFMVILNVVVFGVAGFLGIVFLIQTLNRLTISTVGRPERPVTQTPETAESNETPNESSHEAEANDEVDAATARDRESQEPGPLDAIEGHVLGRHVKTVFRCWFVIFSLVGVQMGWVLRPFIGDPSTPFSWFRERESNFFESVAGAIVKLFTG